MKRRSFLALASILLWWRTKRTTKDFGKVIQARVDSDPELAAEIARLQLEAELEQIEWDRLERTGLTHSELDELFGYSGRK